MNISEIEEKLKGISAQGYTTERNKHKILDPDLLLDIEEAMFRAIRSEISALLDSLKGCDAVSSGGGKVEFIAGYNQSAQNFNKRIEEAKK